MSLDFIKHQPVVFVETGTNPEDLPGRGEFDYKIPVEQGDLTYLQVKISPIAGTENAISNPSFDPTTGWATSGSGLVVTGLATIGDGSTGEVRTPPIDSSLIPGKLYQVQITVTVMFGTAYLYNGTDLIAEINATGTQTISFTATNDDMKLAIEDDKSYIEITNFSLYRLPENYALGILDSAGVPVEVITFLEDPEYFNIKKDRLTIKVDWDALNIPDGCYYLAITDPETNTCTQFGVYNYDFTIGNTDESGTADIPGWNGSTDGFVIFYPGPGRVDITANVNEIESIINTRTRLCANKDYQIIISMSTSDADVPVVVSSGGNSENQLVNGGTPTDYTYTITPGSLDFLTIAVDNNTVPAATPLAVTIYSITVKLVDEADWTFEFITPDQYALNTYGEEVKKIGIFNNEDGLGFVFEDTNFYPNVKALAKFINRQPTYEKEVDENDIGTKSVAFGQLRMSRIFRIEHVPNYIVDFFALIPIADHVYIDEVEYFIESEGYTPNYSDELDNFATSEFQVSDPTQLIRNINSGQSGAPTVEGEPLTDDRSTEIVEALTMDKVTIR